MSEEAAETPPAPPEIQTELARDMGLLHVTMIGVGAMIGAGIFVLTGLAAGKAGPALIIVFLLNGLVTLLTALSYAELGSCFPEAGGGYLWVKEALPQPNGFLSGWISWFAHAVACSLYAYTFGSFSAHLLERFGLPLGELLHLGVLPFGTGGEWAKRILAVAVIGLFAYINHRGAEETGTSETIVTVLKMIVIAAFIAFGFVAVFGMAGWFERFQPFIPDMTLGELSPHGEKDVPGWLGIIVAMGLTFVAFEGYEIIAQCGEEVVDPKRNIPLSMFISLAIVVPVYMLVAFVTVGGIPDEFMVQRIQEINEAGGYSLDTSMPAWEFLGRLEDPELAMVEAADAIIPWGIGAFVFLLGGIFSTMSALNATIYSSSRVSFAMGRDHNLPDPFGWIHEVRRTPWIAVWVSALLTAIMAVTLPVEDIASATDVMFLFLFVLVNLSVINLRRHRPDLDRGFRVPWVPFIPILATVLNLVLVGFLFYEIPMGSYVSAGYILVGIFIYLGYSRRQEFEAKVAPTAYQETSPATVGEYRVLVPVANPANVEELMALAGRLAEARNGDVTALHVIKVPHQLPVHEGREFLQESKDILGRALAYEQEEPVVPVNAISKISHSISKTILEAATEVEADLILMGWFGTTRTKERVFGSVLDEIVDNATCGVCLVRRAPKEGQAFERILVPLANPRAARLSLDIAHRTGAWFDAPVAVFHLTREEDLDAVRAELAEGLEAQGYPTSDDGTRLVIARGQDPTRAILAEAGKEDLLVMGAPQEGILRRALFGDIPARVAEAFRGPVLLTKPATGKVKTWFQKFFGSRKVLLEPGGASVGAISIQEEPESAGSGPTEEEFARAAEEEPEDEEPASSEEE